MPRPWKTRCTTGLLTLAIAGAAAAQDSASADDATLQALLERLERLEAQQEAQRQALAERDEIIDELRLELRALQNAQPAQAGASSAPAAPAGPAVIVESSDPLEPVAVSAENIPLDEGGEAEPTYFGQFQPGGAGFKVADTPYGDLNISLYTYARYLNQGGLDDSYTDSFGRQFDLDLRNDLQLNKATIYFKGWVGDPRLRYNVYVWTANTNQGLGAQTVVGGALTYVFNPALNVTAGISGLPTTRSTEGNWPYWLRVDNRTIADEFFRGSFTTGFSLFGKLNDHWRYHVMLGNNLSQLGVDAGQLDDSFDTFSGAVVWSPLGFYDNGFGDFEDTQDLRARVGLHYTHSTEDAQSQPGLDDPENSQIRLSDGTRLFQVGAFNTEGRVDEARYQMVSLDAGLKYRGLALEGELYWRQVDNFKTRGDVPVSELDDWGYQLQASAMLVPSTWQAYLSGSQIFGEYGDPWDVALGANWFPYKSRQFRLNAELIYLKNSPVGYYSVPYIVGADGTVLYANAELRF